MSARGLSRGPGAGASLGPFQYGFRPRPHGVSGSILISATRAAPMPALGDMLVLTTDDCYDADFEVTRTVSEADGWWIGCERRPR